MGFLKRLVGGGEPPPPAWSPFERGKDHEAFVELALADLRRRGLTFTYDDGQVIVAGADGSEGDRLGLSNLSQLCAGSDRDEWSRIIASHFTSLLAMQGRDLDALAADYDQVKPILRVRLMPDESMGGVELPQSVTRQVAPGILAVLVFDFPDSTSTVGVDHLDGWPVDAEGAFEQALANLAAEPTPMHQVVDEDQARLTVWYGDSFYVATRALRLDPLLPTGTTDALVAVPNRHTLLVHPIVDESAVTTMQAMFQLAAGLFREGPGSISDQPYWWHDGDLVQIPHREDGRKIAVYPPDEFVALLERVLAKADRA
jgi:hypothetical protein